MSQSKRLTEKTDKITFYCTGWSIVVLAENIWLIVLLTENLRSKMVFTDDSGLIQTNFNHWKGIVMNITRYLITQVITTLVKTIKHKHNLVSIQLGRKTICVNPATAFTH